MSNNLNSTAPNGQDKRHWKALETHKMMLVTFKDENGSRIGEGGISNIPEAGKHFFVAGKEYIVVSIEKCGDPGSFLTNIILRPFVRQRKQMTLQEIHLDVKRLRKRLSRYTDEQSRELVGDGCSHEFIILGLISQAYELVESVEDNIEEALDL